MLKLAADTNKSDIDALCDWLKTYPKLTKGDLTLKLEQEFTKYTGCKYGVFVNSGSSANLLMLSVIKDRIRSKYIALPSVCWSTDLSPIIQLGYIPVLVDCDNSLNMSSRAFQKVIQEYDIGAVINVSVLGIPGSMQSIYKQCVENNILYLEDNCESFGTEIDTVKLGTLATMSSWSTFYGHHISTIEGGFVGCNEKFIYDELILQRSHGWSRDLDDNRRLELQKKYNISDFDLKYRFFELGYNLRNTEIGAFLGLRQLNKVPEMQRIRERNYIYFCDRMREWRENEVPEFGSMYYTWFLDSVPSFALPVIRKNRDLYIDRLQNNKIECRPLIAGAIQNHPVAKKYKLFNGENCPMSQIVDTCGFYLPNHTEINLDDIDYMIDTMKGNK